MAKTTPKGRKSSSSPSHKFTNVRELVLTNASGNLAFTAATSSTGVAFGGLALNPLGLVSVSLSGAAFVTTNIDAPHLRWLSNQAANFGMYRVTRAKIVFVGNVGSTASGTLNLQGFTDGLDAGVTLSTAFVGGQNGKIYDLAAVASGREISVPIPVDSSWKKVSSSLVLVGGTLPFTSGTSTSFTPTNTVNDLGFGGFSYQITGGPVSATVGNFMLDYDVEFSRPMNAQLNV
jgi:hypothetical protein